MADLLSKLNGGELIGFTAVVLGCLTGMCGILGGVWHGVRTTEAEAALKRDLLAAGMSPDEIVRVVAATSGGKVPAASAVARQPA